MSFPPVGLNLGGTDFRRFAPGYSAATASLTTLTTVVSITGKGLLVSAFQTAPVNPGNSRLQITIDGLVVLNDTAFGVSTSSFARDGFLTMMYNFKQSLLIEHSASTTTSTTKVAYLLG